MHAVQIRTEEQGQMDAEENRNMKFKAYDRLRQQLDNDELTQKGFDARVKHLLSGDEHTAEEGTSETKEVKNQKAFMDAAHIFTKAKQLMKPQVKKCQFPLRQKGKPLLKIKMTPMEWKPRTAKKPGRYQKIILEEAPPRMIVTGTEGYDELLKLGQEAFWSDKEREGVCLPSARQMGQDGRRNSSTRNLDLWQRSRPSGSEHFTLDVEKWVSQC
ncbi:uncharacterized protein [Chanodichthys erythropterus]|uniref:uncharacterized protein n=1 Tax=Chanodichthys erythropterus TaxID=933992 RepID=UPI00351F0575